MTYSNRIQISCEYLLFILQNGITDLYFSQHNMVAAVAEPGGHLLGLEIALAED